MDDIGAQLRQARTGAGVSLASVAARSCYSASHLSNVEAGRRTATPDIVLAYARALGEGDVHRRQVLGLAAGVVGPVVAGELIRAGFTAALDGRGAEEDWRERVDQYGRDYMAVGAAVLQARLASDLVVLQQRLDTPSMWSHAARALVTYGKTTADPVEAIRWYDLAATAADRSDDLGVRVWVRGRAAIALAYEGAALTAAQSYADQAIELSDRPSLGRVQALMARAHVAAGRGDRAAAITLDSQARRVFDRVASPDGEVSDTAVPPWRMATFRSMLYARLGLPGPGGEAQEEADRTRPTQQDVAEALNRLGVPRGKRLAITANQISRWERGVTYPSALYRQLLAEHFGVSVQTLGLTRQRITPHRAEPSEMDTGGLIIRQESDTVAHPQVVANQDEWRAVRRKLNGHRVPLAREAARLYGKGHQLADTGLITVPGWLPPAPIEFREFGIAFSAAVAPPLVTGTEDAAAGVRPLASPDRRHQRYSLALRDVEQPKLFENRLAWHLTGVDWLSPDSALTFTEGTYFGGVDVSEALAHEMAAFHIAGDGSGVLPASWRRLVFRRLVGDPFAGGCRPAVPVSVDTLTLRADPDGVTFVLHNRAAGKVAMAGGTLHIIPAGVFQPSSVLPAAQANDFDLWRNIVREYSEEFLGNAEHGGEGEPADYRAEPLASLDEAYQAGDIRVFCLGVALDALTLWGEILTVAVFDGPTYDRLFADMVTSNAEGTVVTTGRVKPTSALPFTRHAIDELASSGQLAPAAAGCIQLAWEHRRTILGRG